MLQLSFEVIESVNAVKHSIFCHDELVGLIEGLHILMMETDPDYCESRVYVRACEAIKNAKGE